MIQRELNLYFFTVTSVRIKFVFIFIKKNTKFEFERVYQKRFKERLN